MIIRCLLCGESLNYQKDVSAPLNEHLEVHHPTVPLSKWPVNQFFDDDCEMCSDSSQPKEVEHDCQRVVIGAQNYNFTKTSISSESFFHKKYSGLRHSRSKLSIDDWQPGFGAITCPSCGTSSPPKIERPKSKMPQHPLIACAVYGCWPFCFIPLLSKKLMKFKIHCNSCSNFLGTYNRSSGKLVVQSPVKLGQSPSTPLLTR